MPLEPSEDPRLLHQKVIGRVGSWLATTPTDPAEVAVGRIPYVPGWAKPLDLEAYRRFLAVVARDLLRRGFAVTFHGETVEVVRRPTRGRAVTAADGQPLRLGLRDLAQTCAASTDHWASIVARHFDRMNQPPLAEVLRAHANPTSLVRSRLFAEADHDGTDLEVVRRPVFAGVIEAISVDLGDAVVTPDRDGLSGLGLDDDALFALGRANLRRYDVPTVTLLDDPPPPVSAAHGDSFFSSTWGSLFPDTWLDLDPDLGALLAVPNRHVTYGHAIRGPEVASAVVRLCAFAEQGYLEGPGSVSPALVWWRDGHHQVIPTTSDEGTVTVLPPPEFVPILESLRPESGW